MPYCNFDDTVPVSNLYEQHLLQDDDGGLLDFLGEKILVVGSLFDTDDSPSNGRTIPQNQHPYQALHLQNGFFHFSKTTPVATKKIVWFEVDYSLFKETKFQQEFASSVFHPPSIRPAVAYSC